MAGAYRAFQFLVGTPQQILNTDSSTSVIDGSSLVMKLLSATYDIKTCVGNDILKVTSSSSAGPGKPEFYDFAGFVTMSQISSIFPPGSERDPGLKSYIDQFNQALYSNEKSLSDIAIEYAKCTNPYFYFPFGLIPIAPPGYSISMNHMNAIVIGKRDNTIYRVEPQYESVTSIPVLDNIIKKAVLDIGKRITGKDLTFVEINETCPQSKTADANCIFWSLLICKEILENPDKSPNEIINLNLNKSKAELAELIKTFKILLVKDIIPKGLSMTRIRWPNFEDYGDQYPDSQLMRELGGKRRKTRKTKKKAKKSKRLF
jgi:hypothetical protein